MNTFGSELDEKINRWSYGEKMFESLGEIQKKLGRLGLSEY